MSCIKQIFFTDTGQIFPSAYTNNAIPDSSLEERIAVLEEEIRILKAEKEVLIRVMDRK